MQRNRKMLIKLVFAKSTTVRYLKSVVCHILVDSASRVKKLQIRHARASRFRGEVRWVWTFHFKKSCHIPSLARVSTNPIFEAKKLEFVVFLVFCINERVALTFLWSKFWTQDCLVTRFSWFFCTRLPITVFS